ncbi:Alpha/Beta hydrolase protein [Mycena crocata]|nr:Alpha/Beta hydrolase protein [Mycena crocata]
MYISLSEIPVPSAAQFTDDDVVQISSSIRDNTRDSKRSISSSIFLGSSMSTPAQDLTDLVASTSAPLGSLSFPRRAVLRETAEKKRYIEIWIGNVLEVSKDVTGSHRSFYTDDFYSALSFSPSESAVMYVAEGKEPTDTAEKYKFVPHLGEGLVGKKRPTIFVFRWDSAASPCQASLTCVSPIIPEDHTILFGQPVFSPLEHGTIYATGYEYTRDGRLLAPRWCFNRPSGIWEIRLPSGVQAQGSTSDEPHTSFRCVSTKLTAAHLSCRSPRVYHDKSTRTGTLFWLSCASGGPHAGTFALHAADLTAAPRNSAFGRVLVDTVWDPRAEDGFPGLYPDNGNLPLSPFLTLAQGKKELHLVFSSTWGARTTVLLVSAADGSVRDLTPDVDGKLYSWSVLATDGVGRVVCARSAPTTPHELVLGENKFNDDFVWRVIYTPYVSPPVQAALSSLVSSVVPIVELGRIQTVVLRPASPEATPPCIQYIHGGPHSVATTAFSPATVALTLEGYTVSQPNYSGSAGDCIATARHLVRLGVSEEGKGKQFVMGGSHGGFLTAHLIGQFPSFFTAAVIRNPVISTDPLSSDIPDWYFNEWNIEYPMYSSPQGYPTHPPDTDPNPGAEPPHLRLPPRRTPAESQRIFATAPIAHVDAVTAHVLLHIGSADQRVTPTHGAEYYHALKGRTRNAGLDQCVEMQWFEKEDHSLDGVETARIVWETTRDWFGRHGLV